MTTQTPRRPRSRWTTVHKVISAIAALITAVAGLIGALNAIGVLGRDDRTSPITTTTRPAESTRSGPTTASPPAAPATSAPPTTLATQRDATSGGISATAPPTKPPPVPIPSTGRTTVTITWSGDRLRCTPDVAVMIGDSVVTAPGTDFTMEVPLGFRNWSVIGSAACSFQGLNCTVSSSGSVQIAAGATLRLTWREGPVLCLAELS